MNEDLEKFRAELDGEGPIEMDPRTAMRAVLHCIDALDERLRDVERFLGLNGY